MSSDECCGEGGEEWTCFGACANDRCCWLCSEKQAEACCMTSTVTLLIVVPPLAIVFFVVRPWLGFDSRWGMFHLIFGIFIACAVLYSYWTTVYSDPGAVLPTVAVPLNTKDSRFCAKCNIIKPPRAHHCSVCQKWFDKHQLAPTFSHFPPSSYYEMDHHCPFVANCVALRNRRFFVQFLFWAVVGLTWSVGVLVAKLLSLRNDQPLSDQGAAVGIVLIVGGVVLVPLCLALGCLFSFHCNLLVTDMTTIEQSQYGMRKIAEMRDLAAGGTGGAVMAAPGVIHVAPRAPKSGWRHNFVSNCGSSPLLWFVPIHDDVSSGRSLHYDGDDSGSESERNMVHLV